jgi:chaperonin GroES
MIKPVMDGVLIEVDREEKKSKGGLFLPFVGDTLQNTGYVVAVGESPVVQVEIGSKVLFDGLAGVRFAEPYTAEQGGYKYTAQRNYIIVPFYDIIAVLEGEE